ncbi:MAG: M28 family peptidase [Pseudomonadota bacterium]
MTKPIALAAAIFALAAAFAPRPAAAQAAAPLAPEVRAVAETLIDKALAGEEVGLAFTEDLTTEIGPRLAGSDAEARARDWAVAELTALGFSEVAVEDFAIPFWSRIIDEAEVTAPAPQPLVITALGGSAATPNGGVTAELVRFERLGELEAASVAEVSGRIVFLDEPMTRTMDGSGYGPAVAKRRACAALTAERGGAACLIRSVGTQARRFPHTGMMARGQALGAGPAAALSPPDADQLARLMARGPVRVRLNIQVETRTGAPSGNVIAEIPGTDLADEIVLIGCHLDSWDLATGALDDGAGCGIVVGAAKLIMDHAPPPRRTIRVVLYGAEEVGLLGADAYARRHVGELDNHVFASESDFGADRIWRLETRFGEGALGYARALQDVLAPLGVLRGNNEAFGGPDIGILRRAGVPVVTPRQNGQDYFDYHHTPDDTFDKIVPDAFRQNVAAYAAMTYVVARTGWDLRRPAPEQGLGTQ